MSRREHRADTEATLYPWAVVPDAQIESAANFGRLVAQGVVTVQEVVPSLLRAAQAGGYTGDPGGARTLLTWRVREAETAWQITRAKADVAIRKTLGPMIQDREPGRAILALAHGENRLWGEPFRSDEIEMLTREEAIWSTRRGSRENVAAPRRFNNLAAPRGIEPAGAANA